MTDYIRHPDQPDVTDIKLVDGVFCKMMYFRPAEMHVPQHAHEYDHLSLIATGAVRVWADERLMGEFVAPAFITIKARVKHRFLTLVPGTTVVCIHNADRGDEVPIHEEHQLVEV